MSVTVTQRKTAASILLTPAFTKTLGHAECHVRLDEDLPGGQSNPSKKLPTDEVWKAWRFNHLNPTCYVMHHQFNIQQLYVLPTLYLCVLYLSENKQRLVPLTA